MEAIWTANEFWSAIVGAIVGGGIGLLGQWLTTKQTSRIKKEETSDRRSALGHSLIFKLIKIHSQLHNLLGYMQEASTRKSAIGENSENWQFVLPVANLPDKISFDADEMGMMLSLGNNEAFNSVLGVDVVHNDLIGIFATYRDLRNDLSKEIPQSTFDGQVGSFGITQEHYSRLRPRMIELNYLADQMLERCRKDTEDAWKALQNANTIMKEKNITKYSVGRKDERSANA